MNNLRLNLIIVFITFCTGVSSVAIADILIITSKPKPATATRTVVFKKSNNVEPIASGFVNNDKIIPALFCNDPNIKPIWSFILKEIGEKQTGEVYDCSKLVKIIYFNLDNTGASEILVLGDSSPFWLNRGNTKFYVFKKKGKRFENVLSGYTQNDSLFGSQVLTNTTLGHYDILLRFQFGCCNNYYAHMKFDGSRYSVHREWVDAMFIGSNGKSFNKPVSVSNYGNESIKHFRPR